VRERQHCRTIRFVSRHVAHSAPFYGGTACMAVLMFQPREIVHIEDEVSFIDILSILKKKLLKLVSLKNLTAKRIK
jgi:hypothetical protein